MSLMTSLVGVGASSTAINLPTLTVFENASSRVSPVHSGVRFGTDGNIYRASITGAWQQIATWLLQGTASSYYVQISVDSGALDQSSGDAAQLNANADYYITDSDPSSFPATCTVTFEISSDSGGSTVVAGPKTYNFEANYNPGGEDPA